MSLKHRLGVMAFFFLLSLGKGLFADPIIISETNNERDFDPLKEFIKDKRIENVEETKEGKLVITADVRAEWRNQHEKQQEGSYLDGFSYKRNEFEAELNLYFDYLAKKEKAWVVAHLQYDNDAGVNDNKKTCKEDPEGYHGSGVGNELSLKKAFFGYNFYNNDCSRFDIEIGRRTLYNVFDSKVQFNSRFDGVLLSYEYTTKKLGEFYAMWAGFVVDYNANHCAWITEFGFLDLCRSGWDIKYSFIDWKKMGKNRCRYHNPQGFKYQNSLHYLVQSPTYLCLA